MAYKIIKELGYGFAGTTYLVQKDNKQYAMKIQKVLKEEMDDKTSRIWREIEFVEIAKKYPEQFTILRECEIIRNCKHRQLIPERVNIQNITKYYKRIQKSDLCIKFIYDLCDGVLEQQDIYSFSVKRICAILIQLINIVQILSKNKWIHNDIHCRNIMYRNTKADTININGRIIETYGCVYCAIDYGSMYNYKDNRWGKSVYNDLPQLLNMMIVWREEEMFKKISKDKQNKLTQWKELYGMIMNEKEYSTHIKPYLLDEQYHRDNMRITISIFMILNEERFYDLLKMPLILPNYKIYLKPWLVSKEILLFMYHNITDTEKIISFLIDIYDKTV